MWPPLRFQKPPYQASEPVICAVAARSSNSTGASIVDHSRTRCSASLKRPGECTGWTQPACSASAAMSYLRTVSKRYCALSRSTALKRSPASPWRATMAEGSCPASVGMTWPLLRPDAPQPGSAASTTVTSTPASRRWIAVDRPVKPAPITTTSACTSPSSAGRTGPAGAVAAQSEGGQVTEAELDMGGSSRGKAKSGGALASILATSRRGRKRPPSRTRAGRGQIFSSKH
jgi:hypothetical protein